MWHDCRARNMFVWWAENHLAWCCAQGEHTHTHTHTERDWNWKVESWLLYAISSRSLFNIRHSINTGNMLAHQFWYVTSIRSQSQSKSWVCEHFLLSALRLPRSLLSFILEHGQSHQDQVFQVMVPPGSLMEPHICWSHQALVLNWSSAQLFQFLFGCMLYHQILLILSSASMCLAWVLLLLFEMDALILVLLIMISHDHNMITTAIAIFVGLLIFHLLFFAIATIAAWFICPITRTAYSMLLSTPSLENWVLHTMRYVIMRHVADWLLFISLFPPAFMMSLLHIYPLANQSLIGTSECSFQCSYSFFDMDSCECGVQWPATHSIRERYLRIESNQMRFVLNFNQYQSITSIRWFHHQVSMTDQHKWEQSPQPITPSFLSLLVPTHIKMILVTNLFTWVCLILLLSPLLLWFFFVGWNQTHIWIFLLESPPQTNCNCSPVHWKRMKFWLRVPPH